MYLAFLYEALAMSTLCFCPVLNPFPSDPILS